MSGHRGHLPAITGIRGIAALLIVVFHMFLEFRKATGSGDAMPGMRFGWVGVDLFFVLSGFLLAWVLWSANKDPRSPRLWKSYIVQRSLRIIPTYYVALLATMIMLGVFSLIVDRPGAFLMHLLLLQTFDPTSFNAVSPLYWTLVVELHFYLVLPFLLPLFSRRLWPYALAAALLFTLAWRWVFYTPGTGLFLFYMPAFLFHFALGVVVARFVIEGWRPRAPMLLASAGLLFLVVVPLVTLIPGNTALQALNSLQANLLVRPLVAAGFALMIWSICSPTLGTKILSWRPFELTGNWSYSIYLIHIPLLVLLRHFPVLYEGAPWLYLGVGTTVSLIGGYLLYRLVEDPVNRFRYRLRSRQRAPPAKDNRLPTPEAPTAPVQGEAVAQ